MNEHAKNHKWKATPKERLKFIFSQTWQFFFSLIAPVVLLPVFFWHPDSPIKHHNATNATTNATNMSHTYEEHHINEFEQAPYGLYVTLLMSMYWVTECIPMPVTSLLPVILLPLFGLAGSDEVCSLYFNGVIIFLFAGCVVALSFEYSNLHTRIALFVMQSIGAQPSILLFGMMGTCMVLSCWMNNTSTTAMMVPVISSVMDQYKKKLIPEGSPEDLAAIYGNPEVLSPSASTNSKAVSKTTVNPPEKVLVSAASAGNNSQPPASVANLSKMWPEVPGQKPTQAMDTGPTPLPLVGAIAYWEKDIAAKKKYVRNIEIMLLIGVAVSTNIGGTGVITGTGTNLVATSQLREYQKTVGSDSNKVLDKDKCLDPANQFWDLDFVRWITLNMLPSIVNTFVSWCFLALYFDGLPRKLVNFYKRTVLRRPFSPQELKRAEEKAAASASINSAIKERYRGLGRVTLHERLVIILFLILVSLWILKNPLFLRGKSVSFNLAEEELSNLTIKMLHPSCWKDGAKLKYESGWGWARYFGDKCDESFIHDYVPTLFICFLMFVLPKDPIYYKNILRGGLDVGMDNPILPLDFVAKNIPWGPLVMLGGGFGLAASIRTSHLGDVLKDFMEHSATLKSMHQNALLALVLVLVAVLTSIASNTAVAFIVAPVLLSLSSTVDIPPLYLLVAAVVSASYAFMLPISTPPNAIVYDKGNMKQTDMLVPGFFLTLICNSILYLFTISWNNYLLGVDTYSGACSAMNLAGGPKRRILRLSVRKTHIVEGIDLTE